MRLPILTACLLATIPFASFSSARQDPANDRVSITNDRPLTSADCRVYYYTTRNTDAYGPADIATVLYGNQIPRVGLDGEVTGYADNILQLDETRILVFDTPSNAERILALFEELDVASDSGDLFEDEHVEIKTHRYVPRYLSSSDVMAALSPYATMTRVRAKGKVLPNFELLNQSGVILMRDTPSNLDAMLAVLADIDVPSPQIELTCYVLRGKGAYVENGLPKELTDNLSRLVPFKGFELASMGVVRSSTSGDESNTISIEMLGENEKFNLQIEIKAFDSANEGQEVLTMPYCHATQDVFEHALLDEEGMEIQYVPKTSRRLFTTSAAIQNGEFAVMGATGADPVFVVLRFERVG